MRRIYKGKHKWFDGDCLPNIGDNKNIIDWENSVGCSVQFEVYGVSGTYTILDKITYCKKEDTEFIVKINDIDELYACTKQTLRCVNFAYQMGVYSDKFIYDIGDVVNGRLLILDRYRKVFYEKDKSAVRTYKYKCLIDGYVSEIPEYMILRMKTCPVCSNSVVLQGVNDIATTNPGIVKFLKNSEDAHSYVNGTNVKLNFMCDVCGREYFLTPASVPAKFECHCYSTISYPNRFIKRLFEVLEHPFVAEIGKKTFSWCESYRYDLYFEKDGRKYIIEMDGGQHYGGGSSLWNCENNDDKKDELARKNGVEVIRIDCDYKNIRDRFEYIKNNILKSKLHVLFDLNSIDFDDINIYIIGGYSLVKKVAELRNSGYSKNEICDVLNINNNKFKSLIDCAEKLGLTEKFSNDNVKAKGKVIVITNMLTKCTEFCFGVKNFSNNSIEYIGVKFPKNTKYKTWEDNEHILINNYDVCKIKYSDYLKLIAC